ncbi:MSHA biogenesis protein MshI [Shewanella sp. 10N.286.51.B2]|uniref:MSHA biogenesis protein MshI n=1 Tax=unclassified Shewanella TaxID=196818 RepID=UPI0026E46604|nr:MSHA biogenesis protein MshI [Shewanella sp. 4_MG-2023]MDO6678659.1 MSHA biogenesis protein MshI [Shewanella sp. 4_MG-2023]
MKNGFLNTLAFWRKPQPTTELGLYLGADTISVFQTNIVSNAEQQTDSKTKSFVNSAKNSVIHQIAFNGDNYSKAFEMLQQEFGAAKLQIVLSEAFYQLVTADKPNVQAQELTQALLWSVKDLVSEPVGNIQLDYFESSLNTSGKINVVVANKAQLSQLAQACEHHGFVISGISIEELAMTHLFDDESAHMIVSHVSGQELLLTVVKQGELLMQRRVRGFSQIDSASAQDLQYGLADNLSLEIQRSMDYFESQLRQAPVHSINLLISGESQALVPLVAQNFNQTVSVISHDSVNGHFAAMAYAQLAGGVK